MIDRGEGWSFPLSLVALEPQGAPAAAFAELAAKWAAVQLPLEAAR